MADDDQSIEDQADTATGGLTNDMPNLPISPPGRGGPPSALSGLAQAFQRMMGGAPPPRPIGPGPSPWQAPGRSQLPVQPAQPRWEGTTASLALPRGAPQPRANFTPFMRGPPTTSPSQWGQEQAFANLPQPFENPGIYQGVSKFFGQNGSASIIPLALSMGKNAGAFLQGVMQGQEWKAKMHLEKMKEDAFELEQRQGSELRDYLDIADEYRTIEGVDKPSASYAVNGVTLLDAWANKARQNGDDEFLGVLGTGSVEKALQFIHRRNDNWQTLASANKSTQKQQEEDDKKEWGVPTDQATDANQGEARASSAPSPTQGGPRTPQGGSAPTMSAGGETPLQPYQQSGLEFYREGTPLTNLPKVVRPYAAQYAADLGRQVDAVKQQIQSGQLAPEAVPAALDKIIPGMGTDYKQAYRGVPIPAGIQGRSPYWNSIRNIAVPDPITQATTLRDFASTSHGAGARLTAGARMGPAAITVLEAAKKIPEGEMVPQYVIDQWIAGHVTGDPKYSGLFNALNTYIQDAQSLQSPTGRFYVTEVESLKRNLQTTSGLQAVRTFLQQDAENSTALMEQLTREYQHGAQRPGETPSTFDQGNYDLLKAITLLDPQRGFEGRSDLPPQLQGLGLGAPKDGTTAPTSPNDGFSNFKVNP